MFDPFTSVSAMLVAMQVSCAAVSTMPWVRYGSGTMREFC